MDGGEDSREDPGVDVVTTLQSSAVQSQLQPSNTSVLARHGSSGLHYAAALLVLFKYDECMC